MSSVPDGATDLYRYFDDQERLLYVGISFSAVARASQHRSDKGWWREVARMDVAHYETRSEALTAESAAIRSEKPIHNVIGNTESARSMARRMTEKPSAATVEKAKRNVIEIVGMWALVPPEDADFPRVENQVRIMSEVDHRVYLVQFYSWWDGSPTNTQIIPLSDMRRWKCYETHQAWLDAGEIGMRANDLWADKQSTGQFGAA